MFNLGSALAIGLNGIYVQGKCGIRIDQYSKRTCIGVSDAICCCIHYRGGTSIIVAIGVASSIAGGGSSLTKTQARCATTVVRHGWLKVANRSAEGARWGINGNIGRTGNCWRDIILNSYLAIERNHWNIRWRKSRSGKGGNIRRDARKRKGSTRAAHQVEIYAEKHFRIIQGGTGSRPRPAKGELPHICKAFAKVGLQEVERGVEVADRSVGYQCWIPAQRELQACNVVEVECRDINGKGPVTGSIGIVCHQGEVSGAGAKLNCHTKGTRS